MLMASQSSQDIALLLYPVISSRGDLVSALFKHVSNIQRNNLKCN